MGMMEEIKARITSQDGAAQFNAAEMLLCFWETSPENLEKLLPRPLVPGAMPVAMAVFANYAYTNFGPGYLESSLYLTTRYDDQKGMFCISMPLTSEAAADGHSRLLEYPRKVANAAFLTGNNRVAVSAERFGLSYCRINARFDESFNSDDAYEIIGECIDLESPLRMVHFNYSGQEYRADTLFESDRYIFRREMTVSSAEISIGHADVKLSPSVYEPWYRVGPSRVLGAVLVKGDCIISKKERITKAPPMQFGPYAFSNWDIWMGMD